MIRRVSNIQLKEPATRHNDQATLAHKVTLAYARVKHTTLVYAREAGYNGYILLYTRRGRLQRLYTIASSYNTAIREAKRVTHTPYTPYTPYASREDVYAKTYTRRVAKTYTRRRAIDTRIDHHHHHHSHTTTKKG